MSENGAKPSTQALDAFAEWMRRVDQAIENGASLAFARSLVRRIEALEAKLPDNQLNPKHWRAEPDGTLDPTVQLRRDVGTLVRVVRKAAGEIRGTHPMLAHDLADAVNAFAGDYT